MKKHVFFFLSIFFPIDFPIFHGHRHRSRCFKLAVPQPSQWRDSLKRPIQICDCGIKTCFFSTSLGDEHDEHLFDIHKLSINLSHCGVTSGSPFFAFLEIQAIFEVVAPSDVEDPRSRPCGPGALCGWDEIHGETLWLVDALEYDFLYICQIFINFLHFIYGICFLSSQVTNSVIFQRGRSTSNQVNLMVQHYFWWFNNVKHYFWSLGWYGCWTLGKNPKSNRVCFIVFRIWATKMASSLPHSLPFYLTTLDFDSQLKHDFFGFFLISLDFFGFGFLDGFRTGSGLWTSSLRFIDGGRPGTVFHSFGLLNASWIVEKDVKRTIRC